MKVYSETKNKELCAERLGVSISFLKDIFKEYQIETVIPWRSKAEIELFDFCSSIGKFESNNRKAISPYELDIYSQELNLAIEYCGLYWHSLKDRDYH